MSCMNKVELFFVHCNSCLTPAHILLYAFYFIFHGYFDYYRTESAVTETVIWAQVTNFVRCFDAIYCRVGLSTRD